MLETVTGEGQNEAVRRAIISMAREYGEAAFAERPLEPGRDFIPASRKVFGGAEVAAAVEASLAGWWTGGPIMAAFERALAQYVGVRSAVMTNSGSSANLLAVAALMEGDGLPAARRLRPGDGVLTVACGFPTTVAPLLQLGLKPIFIDVSPETLAPDPDDIRRACRRGRARGIAMGHLLGYPLPLDAIAETGLPFIEDACDALGGQCAGRRFGSWGTVATLSFYPAHHITTGEGGAVLVESPRLKKVLLSLRDWGRDCWCAPGRDNTCGRRFAARLPGLRGGYDHKYVYARLGYNLKATDIQAAIGTAQLARLEEFAARRRANWAALTRMALATGLDRYISIPQLPDGAVPFGWPVVLRGRPSVDRNSVTRRLEEVHLVGTRLFFGGNLLRQPAFHRRGVLSGARAPMPGADLLARRGFWLGVWPGLTADALAYMVAALAESLEACARRRRTDG